MQILKLNAFAAFSPTLKRHLEQGNSTNFTSANTSGPLNIIQPLINNFVENL
jgi:hypothetical protein